MLGFIKFGVLQSDVYISQPDGSAIPSNNIISEDNYSFTCDDETLGEFAVTILENDTRAYLGMNEKIYTLNKVAGDSGARYESSANDIVFLNKVGTASIEKDGNIVHSNCVLQKIKNPVLLNTAPVKSYNYQCNNGKEYGVFEYKTNRGITDVFDAEDEDYIHEYKQDIDDHEFFMRRKSNLPFDSFRRTDKKRNLSLIINSKELTKCSLSGIEVLEDGKIDEIINEY